MSKYLYKNEVTLNRLFKIRNLKKNLWYFRLFLWNIEGSTVTPPFYCVLKTSTPSPSLTGGPESLDEPFNESLQGRKTVNRQGNWFRTNKASFWLLNHGESIEFYNHYICSAMNLLSANLSRVNATVSGFKMTITEKRFWNVLFIAIYWWLLDRLGRGIFSSQCCGVLRRGPAARLPRTLVNNRAACGRVRFI